MRPVPTWRSATPWSRATTPSPRSWGRPWPPPRRRPWIDRPGVAAGPDGNLWFSEVYGNQIGRISPSGAVTEYPVPTLDSGAHGIVAGPDGNLWFAELGSNKIGRITTSGAVTEYPVPTSSSEPY